jgi:hypothetical protein
MDLAFDMPAVRRWADFSGDYNPIHFDLAAARVAGLDALVVHGMLALIPIKQRLSEEAREGWMKFRAAFRNPIAHDSVNKFGTRRTARGYTFHLTCSDSGTERFRGAWGSADIDAIDALRMLPMSEVSIIDPAQLQRFAATYPAVSESWVALDAAVFSDFMRTKLDTVTALASDQLGESAADAHDRVVIQTSHTVLVAPAALPPSAACTCAEWGTVHYTMLPPVMVANASQVSGSVSLLVYRNEQPVMLVELGLLAKTFTDQPTN